VSDSPLIVPDSLKGERADRVLVELFPDYSRTQLTHWLKTGVITVNGTTLKPKTRLHGGEAIQIHGPMEAPSTSEHIEAEPIALDIIYEDDTLMVINKPAGLVVHPGAGNAGGTLINGLVHHDANLKALPRAGIVHRLDKDTTGLLLIAKTLEALTALSKQMQAREIDRRYIALAHGSFISGGKIITGFGRHPRNRLKMAVTPGGREAITHYSIRKKYPALPATLLDIKLMTGRTHQIRVHMAHKHHAIIGDQLYSGRARHPKNLDDTSKALLLGFKRQALHAASLSFTHPVTQETLTLEAKLPDDFKTLLDALDRNELNQAP